MSESSEKQAASDAQEFMGELRSLLDKYDARIFPRSNSKRLLVSIMLSDNVWLDFHRITKDIIADLADAGF